MNKGRAARAKSKTTEGGYVGVGNYKSRPDKVDWDNPAPIDYIISNDPYCDLGNAIVAQAYKDYIEVAFAGYSVVITDWRGTVIDSENNMKDTTVNQGEIEDFFHSELYSLITDIPGDAFIEMAKKEINNIKKAFREGWVWEQFQMYNSGSKYSIDKHEYRRMHNNIRQKYGIESLIRKYESKTKEPGTEHMYRVCGKRLPINPMWKRAVYILSKDKMNFYKWDDKEKDFYKVFNGNKVLERKSYYKKSKYYRNLHAKKGE